MLAFEPKQPPERLSWRKDVFRQVGQTVRRVVKEEVPAEDLVGLGPMVEVPGESFNVGDVFAGINTQVASLSRAK